MYCYSTIQINFAVLKISRVLCMHPLLPLKHLAPLIFLLFLQFCVFQNVLQFNYFLLSSQIYIDPIIEFFILHMEFSFQKFSEFQNFIPKFSFSTYLTISISLLIYSLFGRTFSSYFSLFLFDRIAFNSLNIFKIASWKSFLLSPLLGPLKYSSYCSPPPAPDNEPHFSIYFYVP